MPGTDFSYDLEAPSFAWVIVILFKSGKKYKEIFFPLRNGAQPVKMKRLVKRLEDGMKRKEADREGQPYRIGGPQKVPGLVGYKIIELYPEEHFSRPTLF